MTIDQRREKYREMRVSARTEAPTAAPGPLGILLLPPATPAEYRRIPLTQSKEAIVDAADFERLNQWTWYRNGRGYAARDERNSAGERKVVFMHRVVLPPPDGMATRHGKGGPLDNRKSNLYLRPCAAKESRRTNPHRQTERAERINGAGAAPATTVQPASRPTKNAPLRMLRPYQDAIGKDWRFVLCWPPDPSAISRKHIRKVKGDATHNDTDSLCGIIWAGRGTNLSEKISEESLGECCRECRAVYAGMRADKQEAL